MASAQNSSQRFTMIYYIIPEDQDDPEIPNAFGVNYSLDEVRVQHIRKAFPIEGEYYFRFKFKLGNSIVWMDLNSEDCKLPLFNGRIFVKATRISWENRKKSALTQNSISHGAPLREAEFEATKAGNLTGASYQATPVQPEISKFGPPGGLASISQPQQQTPVLISSFQQDQIPKNQGLSSLESNLLEFDHIFPDENMKKKKPKDQSDLLDF